MISKTNPYTYAVGIRDGATHIDTFGVLPALSLADFERRHKAGRGSVAYIAGMVAVTVGVDLGGGRM